MTTRSRIGVLALQGGVEEHLTALRRCGAEASPVRRASELAAVEGLVLPGGESTTISRLLATFELAEPLRARLAAGMPAYGSCAGMILLAERVLDDDRQEDVQPLHALDVVVRRNAFGRQVDSFETDLDVAGIPGPPVRGVFIRAPQVAKTGTGVDVLATVPSPDGVDGADGDDRIVAVAQGPVLATAFHPELVGGDERVHRYFVQTVRAS